VLALPAGASAKQYKAYAGNLTNPQSQWLNRFFPAKLTIRQGDTVKYESRAFHNVAVLPKGASRPPLAIPDPAGGTYSGILDPQSNPFYYNGQPKFIYNTAAFAKVGDGNVRKNDPGENSGVLLPTGPTAPGTAELKFSAKQTVRVLCLIHPGMQQTVVVRKKKAKRADKPAKVQARAIAEAKKSAKDAAKAAKRKVPAGTVYVGLERKQATNLAYFPAQATVATGQALTFVNKSPSEVHDMVFVGPGDVKTAPGRAFADQHQTATDQLPILGNPNNQFMPDLVYASEPSTSPGSWTYSGDEFGNGYFASPLMDDAAGDPPQGLPGQEVVVFSKPGTYSYYCAIHGDSMAGTVTVQ